MRIASAHYSTCLAERFLALTATGAWLTVPESVTCRTAADYWSTVVPPVGVTEPVAHVRHQLESLTDAHGQRLFDSLEILGPTGAVERVYKQECLVRGRPR